MIKNKKKKTKNKKINEEQITNASFGASGETVSKTKNRIGKKSSNSDTI